MITGGPIFDHFYSCSKKVSKYKSKRVYDPYSFTLSLLHTFTSYSPKYDLLSTVSVPRPSTLHPSTLMPFSYCRPIATRIRSSCVM